jgi:hypothetical protein
MGKRWIKYEKEIYPTSRILSPKIGYSGIAQFAVGNDDEVFAGGLEPGGSPVDFLYPCHDMVFRAIALDFDPISHGKRFFHLEGNTACNV